MDPATGFVLVGIVIAAIAISSSSSSGAKAAPSPASPSATSAWSVKRNAPIFPAPVTSFLVGDFVTVVLVNSATKAEIPAVLKIAGNMGDPTGAKGLDCVFDVSFAKGAEIPTGLPSGTHFAVFPKDISVYVPGSVVPSVPSAPTKALFSHTLTDSDIYLTPLGFAMLAGYGDSSSPDQHQVVAEFVSDNPSLSMTETSAAPGDPSIFAAVSLGKAPGSDIDTPITKYFQVKPWSTGLVVRTKTNLDTLVRAVPTAIPTGLVAGEQKPTPPPPPSKFGRLGGRGFRSWRV